MFESPTGSNARNRDWRVQANDVMGGLRRLRAGWDGFAAAIPTAAAMDTARSILWQLPDYAPEPRVTPTTEGGLQLEWFHEDLDITLEVINQHEISVYYRDEVCEWEGPLGSEPEPIAKLLWRFGTRFR
jgi:hypothetical protein